jgi:hypothetical protein
MTVSWIRTRAKRNVRAVELLTAVDALAKDIFRRAASSGFHYYHRFEPFVTLDPATDVQHHANAVEDRLDELIRGVRTIDGMLRGAPLEDHLQSFCPTEMESAYLCAAVRLRTIGLLWGLFEEERTERNNDEQMLLFDCTSPNPPSWEASDDPKSQADSVVEFLWDFPERTARFIEREWNFDCEWASDEKEVLASIIRNYAPNAPVQAMPDHVHGIRVKELACLLRLATSSLVDGGVCPLELRVPFKPFGISEPRKTNLATLDWIAGSFFDLGKNQFVIQARIPHREDIPDPRAQQNSLPVATVDFGHAVEFLGALVQEVIDSVKPVLGQYINTSIRSVYVERTRMDTMRGPDGTYSAYRYLPDQWILPLASAMNGAEIAGMTATIIRSFCLYGFSTNESISFLAEVEQVCNVVEAMHPFNALALSLVNELRNDFGWTAEPSEPQIAKLHDRMNQYLTERALAGDSTAQGAIDDGILREADGRETDIVVLSHHGRSVLTTIVKSDFKGEVWLVEPSQESFGKWVPNCSDRVEETLKEYGIDVKRIQPNNLFVLLSGLRKEKSIVYLTGAKGMWTSDGSGSIDRFICSVGVWNAVATVREHGGRACLIAEREKQFKNSTTINAILDKLEQVRLLAFARPWTQVELLERKHFDRVFLP